MGFISKETDIAGKTRVTWQSDSTGNRYIFKFQTPDYTPTDQEMAPLVAQQDEFNELSKTSNVLGYEFLPHRDTIVMLIERIKANPTITLAQYNAFLNGLHWTTAAKIRYFIYLFAEKLAERKDVSLANTTEATMLGAIRDFIVNTPNKKLARLIFNEFNL